MASKKLQKASKALRLFMYDRGLTNKETAKALGVSERQCANYKRNKCKLTVAAAIRIELLTEGRINCADWVDLSSKEMETIESYKRKDYSEGHLRDLRKQKQLRNK